MQVAIGDYPCDQGSTVLTAAAHAMHDAFNNPVLEAYDLLLSDINTALAFKSFVEEENRVLKVENDKLMIDSKRKDEVILTKEEEIVRLLEKNLIHSRSQIFKIDEAAKEICASAQLVELKYEVEILLSNQRAHGRELSAQRTENERLLRFNQQLSRELSMAKMHVSELQRQPAMQKAFPATKILQGAHTQHGQNQTMGVVGGEKFQRGRASSDFKSSLNK